MANTTSDFHQEVVRRLQDHLEEDQLRRFRQFWAGVDERLDQEAGRHEGQKLIIWARLRPAIFTREILRSLVEIMLVMIVVLLVLLFSHGLATVSASASAQDEAHLRLIPDTSLHFDIRSGDILAPLLRPRVPGTPSHEEALTHITSYFKNRLPSWNLSFQNSSQKTPISGEGLTPFSNLIVTRDPPHVDPGEVERLLIVAHYDSKLTPEGFIGATDSAAPCAMMMAAAKNLDVAMTRRNDALAKSFKENGDAIANSTARKGLMFLFLDGEEAFHAWSHTDSIYGAKSLAEYWENQPHEALSTFKNPLESIELFVLLDLLGAASPRVPTYYMTTHWAYRKMAELEFKLRSMGIFKSSGDPWFWESEKDWTNWMPLFGLEDDHIPFLYRGVEILHVIPTPFPRVWHHMDDDGAHLDLDTVEDWTKLVTAFVVDWLGLKNFMPDPAEKGQANLERR